MAAAHTFFQANPDHMEMKQNLEYYRMMARVEEENFKDLEAKPHMVRACLPSADFTYTLKNVLKSQQMSSKMHFPRLSF